MGLLYEYSKADDFAYRQQQPTRPDKEPDEPTETPDETPDAAETSKSDTDTTDERVFTGGDIVIASLVTLGTFLVLMFGTLFVFAFVMLMLDPTLLEAGDPNAAAEAIIAPYQEAYGLQYAYIATLYGLGIFAGTLFVAMRTRWNWQLLGVNPVDWPEVAYAVMIGTAGALAIIGGTLASQQAAGVLDEQLTGLRQALTETSPVLIGGAAVLFVILSPIVEELFFRGVIYGHLRRRGRFWVALLVSSLVYASLNLNPTTFFANLALGAALALVLERTQSIWGAVAAHSAFNAVTVLLYLLILNVR